MGSEARCDRSDLPVSMCAHCRGDRQVADPPASDRPAGYGPVFFARFDGRCADCGDQFVAGERIAALTDGGGYVCEDCIA